MATIQLDIAFSGAADSLEESLANLAPDGIFYRIIQLAGPAGGWPVVEFKIDNYDQASALLSWYSGSIETVTGPEDELESALYGAFEL